MKSMYIHIPFCKSICSYCDFCKVLYHGPWVRKYIDALENEMKERYKKIYGMQAVVVLNLMHKGKDLLAFMK